MSERGASGVPPSARSGAAGEGPRGRRDGSERAGADRVARLRERITECDRELIDILRRRLDLVREIGDLKDRLGIPVTDPRREAAVVRRAAALAREEGLDEELVRSLIWSIMSAARHQQLSLATDPEQGQGK